MKKIAFFIAFQGFRDEEYTEPVKLLRAAGCEVTTVSTARGLAQGKFRATAEVDKIISEVNPADYDALALVGGPGALEHLDKPEVHALLRAADGLGKVLGAICISPVVLAHAGLLAGKKAACWPDGAPELEKAGCRYTGADLEIDGRFITANGPVPARKYGQALLDAVK
jgi:protease I